MEREGERVREGSWKRKRRREKRKRERKQRGKREYLLIYLFT